MTAGSVGRVLALSLEGGRVGGAAFGWLLDGPEGEAWPLAASVGAALGPKLRMASDEAFLGLAKIVGGRVCEGEDLSKSCSTLSNGAKTVAVALVSARRPTRWNMPEAEPPDLRGLAEALEAAGSELFGRRPDWSLTVEGQFPSADWIGRELEAAALEKTTGGLPAASKTISRL